MSTVGKILLRFSFLGTVPPFCMPCVFLTRSIAALRPPPLFILALAALRIYSLSSPAPRVAPVFLFVEVFGFGFGNTLGVFMAPPSFFFTGLTTRGSFSCCM